MCQFLRPVNWPKCRSFLSSLKYGGSHQARLSRSRRNGTESDKKNSNSDGKIHLIQTGESASDHEEGRHPDTQSQIVVQIQEEEGLPWISGRDRTAGQSRRRCCRRRRRFPEFRIGRIGRSGGLHVPLRLQRPDARTRHVHGSRWLRFGALHAPPHVLDGRTWTRILVLGPRTGLHLRPGRLQFNGKPPHSIDNAKSTND